jgi:hypothetical protein
MKMYNDDELNLLYQNKSNMAASSEPFFKIIYLCLHRNRMFYEIIFVTEEQHSGIAIYLGSFFFF